MQQLKKKDNESFEALMRRFNRLLQQEGTLIVAREELSRKKKVSKTKRREGAIRKRIRKENKIKQFLF